MNNTSIVLSGLLIVAMAIMMAPSIIAMNKGRVLRNIAAWLAIVLALALAYQIFHPERGMVMPSRIEANRPAEPQDEATPSTEPSVPKLNGGVKEDDDQGYTPPRED